MNRMLVACTALLAIAATPAAAQPYPSRPITVVVPFPAGGPSDVVARIVAEGMGKVLGQTMVIENVGGAGGTIGSGRVASAAADGYTLLAGSMGSHVSAPVLTPNVKYDSQRDFEPIGFTAHSPAVIVAKKDYPAKDLREFVASIKQNGENVKQAHGGVGSSSHMACVLFSSSAGVTPTAVAYRGTGPAMNDLLSGQFDVMCDQTTNTTNQIKEGKIKGFAVTTKAKVSSLPDLPTLDGGAVKGFEVSAWHAMWAPKGLPKEASDKLVAALQAALKDPKVIERFASLGTEPVKADLATPAALKAHLTAEVPRWGAVIKASGAKGN
jgi:tripartite-type tricarboxylate transporter receptor subunit TctC